MKSNPEGSYLQAVAAEPISGGGEICEMHMGEEGGVCGHMEQHPGRQREVQPVHKACTDKQPPSNLLLSSLPGWQNTTPKT